MKRPYREGSAFLVPLGDGRATAGIVTRGTHKAIEMAFFVAGEPWRVRCSDRALVEERWHVVGAMPRFCRADWPPLADGDVFEPGWTERALLAKASGDRVPPRDLRVHDLRGGAPLPPMPDDGAVRLQWRSPLGTAQLERIRYLVATRPQTQLRLSCAACSQAGVLAAWEGLEWLELDAAELTTPLPVFPQVRELRLRGWLHDASLLECFPGVTTLRVRAGGRAPIDGRMLAALPCLKRLVLRGGALENAGALASAPGLDALDLGATVLSDGETVLRLPLRALRLSQIPVIRSLHALERHLTLRALALDGLTFLDHLRPLESLDRLESLDLRGMWHLSAGEAGFALAMPSLYRLRADLGGRRMSAQLYRRRLFAEPLPL
ncbi:MAG TPA: hypothetical protein VMH02_06045 [Verrucomicrobiae bacterium]|nr:hypothetical protein [Verrucomicrobiae bacterium]